MEYDRDWKHSMARLTKDDILDLFAEKMRKIDELEVALAAKTNVATQTASSSPASAVVADVSRSATTEDAASELLKVIETHRTESKITCEESCWCWKVEKVAMRMEQAAEQMKHCA